jgi:citrate synthase
MPEIVNTHLTHIVWAFVCLAVALAVHFWPPIKAWFAARAAAAEAEEKRAKALLKLAGGDIEAFYLRITGRIKDAVDAELAELKAEVAALKARVEDQVAADALKAPAAVDPAVPASGSVAADAEQAPAALVRSLIPPA